MKLISITPNYMDILCTAAAQCHGVGKVKENVIHKIIESGHLSVLEHAHATFELQCSRKVLAQFTRHRHFSFTVQSSRACRLTDMYQGLSSNVDKALEQLFQAYDKALAGGIPYDEASYLLPEGAMCSLVVTGNFRTWFEFLPKRLCSRALPEFRQIASQIYEELAREIPEVFDRDIMNCKNCTEESCEFV